MTRSIKNENGLKMRQTTLSKELGALPSTGSQRFWGSSSSWAQRFHVPRLRAPEAPVLRGSTAESLRRWEPSGRAIKKSCKFPADLLILLWLSSGFHRYSCFRISYLGARVKLRNMPPSAGQTPRNVLDWARRSHCLGAGRKVALNRFEP